MTKGKKIAIFGLGVEGASAANFFGKDNEVTIIDQKSKSELAEFTKAVSAKNIIYQQDNIPKNISFDLIIRSPGIRPDHPLILDFVKNGAELTSCTKLFFDICPSKIIGVTGTKGKGTTSTLIYEMLKADGRDVHLAGNIGTPALDILPKLGKESIVVLELSSFQLMDLTKSPHIAVVLMVTSEHLDWHKTKGEYKTAKRPIVKFQSKSDFAIINQDHQNSRSFAKETRAKVYFLSTKTESNGVYAEDEFIYSKIGQKEQIAKTKDVLLPGRHNLENISAAIAVAKILNVSNQNIRKVLKSFKGLKHRLQLVRVLDGVKYYNDSFSTTPETTIAAIGAFTSPKILIAGGSSKNSDFDQLGKKIQTDKSIKTLILIGQESSKIEKAILKSGKPSCKIIKGLDNMQKIAQEAKKQSESGDVVILSPACASFDMFKNYKDRGEQFIKEVNNLK